MTRRFLCLTTCLFLLFLLPVYAQQPQPPSNGTFTTHIGDRLVMTESYRVTSRPDGSMTAEAELMPAGAGPKQKFVTLALKTRPERFSVDVGGVKALEGKFGNGVVKLNAAGQPEREVRTKATMVLENLVWHQFIFLLGQYDHAQGGRQNFTAFLPSQGVEYPISLEYVSAQTYTLKNRAAVATRRYKMVAAGALVLDL